MAKRYNPVERNVLLALQPSQRGHHDKVVRLGQAHSQHIVRLPSWPNALATLSASVRATTVGLAEGAHVKGHQLILPRAVDPREAQTMPGKSLRAILNHPLLDGAVATHVRVAGDTTVISFVSEDRRHPSWSLDEIDADLAGAPKAA